MTLTLPCSSPYFETGVLGSHAGFAVEGAVRCTSSHNLWCSQLQPHPFSARALRDKVVKQKEKATEVAAASAENGKGPIAFLQEFVQGSKESSLPAGCQILQWSFDQRMVDAKLEFCATVRFLLDGVPHHAVGTWQNGKAAAKRDAAWRALGLFVTCWVAVPESQGNSSKKSDAAMACDDPDEHGSAADHAAATLWETQELVRHCSPLSWSHKKIGQDHVAFVELSLFGVPHKFGGCNSPSLIEACSDTARRVLWYLQVPGFGDNFELDGTRYNAKDIPQAPHGWMDKDSTPPQAREVAKQRTLLMNLQNRLQQAYSKQIEERTPAIIWDFQRCNADQNSWVPCVRATATVPAANRTFTSDWQRTQREARIDACMKVSAFLDLEDA
jgi:hypothetical protein